MLGFFQNPFEKRFWTPKTFKHYFKIWVRYHVNIRSDADIEMKYGNTQRRSRCPCSKLRSHNGHEDVIFVGGAQCAPLKLSFYFKSVFTSWTYDGMLSLSLWQTKHRTTRRTFSVNVCFSISVLILHKLEKAHKSLVFTAPFLNISRHRSVYHNTKKCPRKKQIRNINVRIFLYKEKHHHIYDNKCGIAPQKSVVEFIIAVPPVHKSVKSVFYFSHLIALLCTKCLNRILL